MEKRKVARPKVKPGATLGDLLRAEREYRGISQKAAGAEIDISQAQFSKWESDLQEPSDSYIAVVTEWLGVDEKVIGPAMYWSKLVRAESLLSAAARRSRL